MKAFPPVVLCGFMGCGKSAIGQLAARELGMEFIDADQYIERQAGMKVSEIFSRYGENGENGFRDREHQAMKELSERSSCIVAAGGGALTFQRNVDVIRGKAYIIYLDTPFQDCYSRIAGDGSRPLAVSGSREELETLYRKREGLYRAAADRVVVNDGSLNHGVQELVRIMGTLVN